MLCYTTHPCPLTMDNDGLLECTGCSAKFTECGLLSHLLQTHNLLCRQIFLSFFVCERSQGSPAESLPTATSDKVSEILGGISGATLDGKLGSGGDTPMDLSWEAADAEDTDIHFIMDDEVNCEEGSESELKLNDDDDEFYWCVVIYWLCLHCYNLC